MKGRDFVACAERLSQSTEEADLRSAVSRGYYGAFHEIRAALREFGIRLPKTEQVHVKMEYCLRNCGDSTAEHIGFELERLRARRKAADYELDDSGIAASSKVETEIARARRILLGVEKCRNSTDVRSKLRAQAKLLGLPVSD